MANKTTVPPRSTGRGHTSVNVRLGALTNSELASLSDAALCSDLVETARARAALMGREAQVSAEIQRRQAFRAEGATSLETWLAASCGHSRASARALAHVGERLFDLPHLQEVLSSGQASFDQVRALVDAADPESDARWADEATRGLSVRELTELARRRRPEKRPSDPERPTVRFNDERRTMTARLPSETYAEVRGHLERVCSGSGNGREHPVRRTPGRGARRPPARNSSDFVPRPAAARNGRRARRPPRVARRGEHARGRTRALGHGLHGGRTAPGL